MKIFKVIISVFLISSCAEESGKVDEMILEEIVMVRSKKDKDFAPITDTIKFNVENGNYEIDSNDFIYFKVDSCSRFYFKEKWFGKNDSIVCRVLRKDDSISQFYLTDEWMGNSLQDVRAQFNCLWRVGYVNADDEIYKLKWDSSGKIILKMDDIDVTNDSLSNDTRIPLPE